jgi:protein-S-isoprenylcysteine O-methyltransferase Ste14
LQNFLFLATQVLLILILILCGWGLGDVRQFFADPVLAGLVAAVIFAAVAVLILKIDVRPTRKGRLPLGHQTFVLLALLLASIFLFWFLPFANRRHIFTFAHRPAVSYFGLLLCCGGIVVRLLALKKLGGHFSAYVTLQEEHELIQSGIYRHIRHPLYLSLLLAAPGFALVFDNWLVFPIFLGTVIFVARRIPQEEDLLGEHFGETFLNYRRRTWILIPLLV